MQQGVERGLWRTAAGLGKDWPALGGVRKWAVPESGFPGWGQVSHGRLASTGITAYLEHPEARVGVARYPAGHAKTETTKLYDRREERVSLDAIARVGI